MQNMEALSLTIEKLWPLLKFFGKDVTLLLDLNLDGWQHTHRKAFPQDLHM